MKSLCASQEKKKKKQHIKSGTQKKKKKTALLLAEIFSKLNPRNRLIVFLLQENRR